MTPSEWYPSHKETRSGRTVWGMASTAPTNELGTPGGIRQDISPTNGSQSTWKVDPLERSWELQFPRSVAVFDRMRTEETHVGAVLSAIKLAIRGARWDIDDTGVKPEVAQFVRAELGLAAPGEARARRRRQGISFHKHIEQACHSLWAGFMVFEQVYEIGPPLPGQEAMGRDVVHLRKLAP